MYKFIDKQSCISGVKSLNNEIYYTQNNILKHNGDDFINDVEGSSFWAINDCFYYHNNEGLEFVRKANQDREVKEPLFTNALVEKYIFCCMNFRRENRKWKWELGLFDLESLSVVKELPLEDYTVELVVDNVGIGYFDRHKISALDINEFRIKWELALSEYEDIKHQRIFGVYGKQLLVACSGHLLLSIDINTGEILHRWHELKGFEAGSFYKDVLPDPTNFVLDENAHKLIGVFHTYYFEIDLDSKDISYYQLDQELSKYGITDFRPFFNNPFTSNHLFLTAHTFLDEFPNIDLSSVLALNRETKKVDWAHVFKDVGLGTNTPQITDTHLYQLDLDNTLHIFEKE